jgi:hypothetical protein
MTDPMMTVMIRPCALLEPCALNNLKIHPCALLDPGESLGLISAKEPFLIFWVIPLLVQVIGQTTQWGASRGHIPTVIRSQVM